MTTGAKAIRVERISSHDGERLIRALHYSGKVVRNSKLHLGVFLNGRCYGAMSFGPPLDKSKLLGLVRDTPWDGMLELNRMAFGPELPRNSESRAIGVALRMIARAWPTVKWIVSFADATQCGDGTIYRAAGFLLTGIRPNRNTARIGNDVVHKMTLEANPTLKRDVLRGRSYFDLSGGRYDFAGVVKSLGGTILHGFQLRYLAFIDATWRERLTVPVLPYAAIAEAGAGMYKGHARAEVVGIGLPARVDVQPDPRAPITP